MQQSSIDFLNTNRHHYNCLVNAGFVRNYDMSVRQGVLDVIRKEFDPGYQTTLWCGECVMTMLKYAYVQYDKWIEANEKFLAEQNKAVT